MITAKDKKILAGEINHLALEVAEIKEISDLIFRRIEKKIVALNDIEAEVDKKIATLEQLMKKADQVKTPAAAMNRHQQVVVMRQRGCKLGEIARTLQMPVGEVELILGMHLQKA